MARVVVLGAGISGHTAAMILRRKLGREHEIVVVTPNRQWNWIPSNIWVGVGRMSAAQVTFALAPVYERLGITLHQARAVSLHPEGDGAADAESKPYVTIESTAESHVGEATKITYDYLINATGPKLNFAATPGLGPDGNSLSVCTYSHAEHAAKALAGAIALMKTGVMADHQASASTRSVCGWPGLCHGNPVVRCGTKSSRVTPI